MDETPGGSAKVESFSAETGGGIYVRAPNF